MELPLLVPELATKGMRLMVMMRRLELQRQLLLVIRMELVLKPRLEKGLNLLMQLRKPTTQLELALQSPLVESLLLPRWRRQYPQ